MKKIISIITASMLCSCGFMTPVNQYAGDRQDVKAIAVIQSYVENPLADEYHATITSYTKTESSGVKETKKFGLPGFTDYASKIYVLPGEFEVNIYCFKGFTSYRPKVKLALQAGQTYLLNCDVLQGQAFIKVQVNPT
ncbi:MAG: hypothetical protein ACKVOA_02975 [Methylophilaceae bacterium]